MALLSCTRPIVNTLEQITPRRMSDISRRPCQKEHDSYHQHGNRKRVGESNVCLSYQWDNDPTNQGTNVDAHVKFDVVGLNQRGLQQWMKLLCPKDVDNTFDNPCPNRPRILTLSDNVMNAAICTLTWASHCTYLRPNVYDFFSYKYRLKPATRLPCDHSLTVYQSQPHHWQ